MSHKHANTCKLLNICVRSLFKLILDHNEVKKGKKALMFQALGVYSWSSVTIDVVRKNHEFGIMINKNFGEAY